MTAPRRSRRALRGGIAWLTRLAGVRPAVVASLPSSSRRLLYAAAFSLFASIGFIADLLDNRVAPVAAVLGLAGAVGLSSVLVLSVAAHFPRWTLVSLGLPVLVTAAVNSPGGVELASASPGLIRTKLLLDGIGCLTGFIFSYAMFMRLIGTEASRYARVHAEVALAREIHQLLVPGVSCSVEGYEFCGTSIASSEVGGDLVDFVTLGSGWVGYVADVSGHGVGSGLLMGILKSAIRTRVLSGGTLSTVLTDVNRVLVPLSKRNMYATFAALHDDGSGQLTAVTAGHPPILHYQAAQRRIERIVVPQIPLGVFDDRIYTSVAVTAAPGDLFVIVTDGLTEVFDKQDREFGLERLADVVHAHTDQPLKALEETILRNVRNHGPQSDDQTMLLISVAK
jgi:hypothetical protein